ncbi:RidA family protein [Alteromonas sp. 5E99-2]|uniref:RidA family protein n=1 Tax=Alteromonas sp. 5E99-2 TaxID=2817683 RepID=UPI001A980EE9|nr:RidA family protein [Alteromonas sp. 5E99-2]MBO1254860.1 RidA family protein [Alteromonas sp. 5E99-2]
MKTLISLCATTLLLSTSAMAEVTRHKLPNNSTFPIARAVEVPADTALIYHSGQVPSPANPKAEKFTAEYYGDTEAQTLSIFKKFEESFKDLGVDFGDAVKLTVFLVGDPKLDGKMDFAGFMKAYTQYFGTEAQPNLPARSAVQVASLVRPNMLVEIDMVLAKPSK